MTEPGGETIMTKFARLQRAATECELSWVLQNSTMFNKAKDVLAETLVDITILFNKLGDTNVKEGDQLHEHNNVGEDSAEQPGSQAVENDGNGSRRRKRQQRQQQVP